MLARPLFDLRAETDVPKRGSTLSCVECGLYRGVLSPRMAPAGDFGRGIMVVGEGPGEVEDERGKPWQGPAGRLLRRTLADLGADLWRDCVSLNAANCRPMTDAGRNREPTPHEVACCRVRIVNPALARYRPHLILLLGGSAVSSLLGPLCAEALSAAIGKWRGFRIPVPELGAWVCPTFHPSYVLREEKRPEVGTVWRLDLRQALELVDVAAPIAEDMRRSVRVLRAEDEILAAIREAHSARFLSHDYETTGLRAAFHDVVCASFATSSDEACAFAMPASGPVRDAWAGLMADPAVGKISHNMKFEDEWTREHFGVAVNWAWDSMIGAHVMDNRGKIGGLKLQAFLNFGVRSWGDEIEPYLKSANPDDPRAPNRVREFIERRGEDECLVYCGIDSLMAMRLALRQMEVISGETAA